MFSITITSREERKCIEAEALETARQEQFKKDFEQRMNREIFSGAPELVKAADLKPGDLLLLSDMPGHYYFDAMVGSIYYGETHDGQRIGEGQVWITAADNSFGTAKNGETLMLVARS